MEQNVQAGRLSHPILPVCCFAPVHWWHYYVSGSALLDVHETYVKQTVRNRMIILGVNGPVKLTIPVQSLHGEKKPVSDIRISGNTWISGCLKSIRSAYGRAAFFEFYFDEVERIFLRKHSFLLDLNLESTHCLASGFKLAPPVLTEGKSPEYDPSNVSDLRGSFEPASPVPQTSSYPQVFSDRHGFVNGLSAIDLLFNMGPKSVDYVLLKKNSVQSKN